MEIFLVEDNLGTFGTFVIAAATEDEAKRLFAKAAGYLPIVDPHFEPFPPSDGCTFDGLVVEVTDGSMILYP